MNSIYFDNAATTQLRQEVVVKMTDILQNIAGNPSSTHAEGRKAKSLVEQARKTVAKHLNVTPGEIIFTSGGTEADNLIINGAVRDMGIRQIITSRIEHHAVLHCIEHLENHYHVDVNYVQVDANGDVNLKQLEQLLKNGDQRALVSLMHINNEVGNRLDIKKVADLCKEYKALFHSDMVQSIGHYDIDLKELGVDFVAASAHKFHGPKGIGFAYIRKGTGLKPLIFGGGQERGYRAGTEAVHNIVGLEQALDLSLEKLAEEKAYISELKSYFIAQLEEAIPNVKFNGACTKENSTYTLLNVCLPMASEKAVMFPFQMDLKGIACSKGSACQSGSDMGSHVLQAFLSKEDLDKPSVRFSFSIYNTKEEVDFVVNVLKEQVNA